MSGSVQVNAVTFVSLKEASEISAYSQDYLSRLARQEKVVATKIGRQWFIDPVSLQNFLESTKIEKEIRSQQLRAERKQEQVIAASQSAVVSLANTKIVTSGAHARLATVAVLVCGALSGLLLHVANERDSFSHSLGFVAQVPSSSVTAEKVRGESTSVTEAEVETDGTTVPVTGSRPLQAGEGILLFPTRATERETTEVAELFSDEVVLSYVSKQDGVVSAKIGSTVSSEVSFVTVPVRQERASSSVTNRYD